MGSNPFRDESDLQAYLQRARAWRVHPGGLSPSHAGTPPEPPACDEPESKLQGEIMKWAKERGYPCQCFRQSKRVKGILVSGWPD